MFGWFDHAVPLYNSVLAKAGAPPNTKLESEDVLPEPAPLLEVAKVPPVAQFVPSYSYVTVFFETIAEV